MAKDMNPGQEAKPRGSAKRKNVKEEGDGDGTRNGDAEDTPTKLKKPRAPRKKASPKTVDLATDDDGEEGVNGVEDDAEEEEVKIEATGIVGGKA